MTKIVTIDSVSALRKKLSDPIILTGGCFDVLHPGHIHFLSAAKEIGGTLMVLLESDEKIREQKGVKRPIHTQQDRAVILSALSMIDYIIPLPYFANDNEYKELVLSIKPTHFAITKDDPVTEYVTEYAQILGASVVQVTHRISKYSTTELIKQLNT